VVKKDELFGDAGTVVVAEQTRCSDDIVDCATVHVGGCLFVVQ